MNALINEKPVEFSEGETILEAARRAGVYIPTLCEFAALNHRPGTCRMCLTEVTDANGCTRIVTACDTRLLDGDVVRTRTQKVRRMQKLQAELLFADHCETCSGCARHGHCEMQTVAKTVGLDVTTLTGKLATRPAATDTSANGLIFTPDKCIRCMRCIEACRQVQGIGVIRLAGTGTDARIAFDAKRWGDSATCIQCGQCALVCPTGALAVKDQTDRAFDLFEDPDVTTVVQFAPAVRVTIGEALGLQKPENLEGQLIAALKRLGADYVCDTLWSADVTIMEEGTELLERLRRQKADGTLATPDTMMTSCCPGWINHAEKNCPAILPHLSTTRSPQAIFGALAHTWLPKALGVDAKRIRCISIMPCTAKKDEALRERLMHEGRYDVDLVLTVQEFATMLERAGIDLTALEPQRFDSPFMSEGTGAAQLFAASGGVMEAALRTVSALTGGADLGPIAFESVRGLANFKEAAVETKEFGVLRVAVVHGMRAADEVVKAILAGTSPYHFVEVMACPGGCVGGGGTLRGVTWKSTLKARQDVVYDADKTLPVHSSHQNCDVARLYGQFLDRPGSHLAHELLHCEYDAHDDSGADISFESIGKEVELATV